MGVKRLLYWQYTVPSSSNNPSPTQVLKDVGKALEALETRNAWGAVHDAKTKTTARIARWYTKVAILRHVNKEGFQGHGKDLYVVQYSDEPEKWFFLLRHERVLIEADTAMFAVLNKTQLYNHKISFNVDGVVHALGDLSARLAKVTLHTGNFAGIVLEVEYHPLEDVEVAEPVFANFCSMLQGSTDPLLGSFKPVSAAFGDFNLGTTYSGKHCALQYVGLVHSLLNVLAQGASKEGKGGAGSASHPPTAVATAPPAPLAQDE